MIRSIKPEEAAQMLVEGAALVDIREAPERAGGVIPGAESLPLSSLPGATVAGGGERPVIFHCRSGRRTETNAELLQQSAGAPDVFLLEGGLDAWRAAGLPVTEV